jgi:hypothetical protein
MMRKCSNGLTLLEVMMAVGLSAMLFLAGFRLMSQARKETVKGLWLQKAIIALRNGTREISLLLKKTSYPSTMVKRSNMEVVVSYKDYRVYDDSGRLRDIKTKDAANFDVYALSGRTTADGGETTILRFPVCEPETDMGTLVPGKIIWNELIYRPQPTNPHGTPLGTLFLIQREDTYQTQGLPFRAFSLAKTFDPGLPTKREKALIPDVEFVEVLLFSVDELRGIAVSDSGAVARKTKRRFLLTLQVGCCHPTDAKIAVTDQCSIVSNIDIFADGGAGSLVVLQVTGSQARVNFNGTTSNVVAGSIIGGVFKVTTVFPTGITVVTIPGNSLRTYYVTGG